MPYENKKYSDKKKNTSKKSFMPIKERGDEYKKPKSMTMSKKSSKGMK